MHYLCSDFYAEHILKLYYSFVPKLDLEVVGDFSSVFPDESQNNTNEFVLGLMPVELVLFAFCFLLLSDYC